MATDVSWFLELNVQPGREKESRALMLELAGFQPSYMQPAGGFSR